MKEFFFNSKNDDKKYGAMDFVNLLSCFTSKGVSMGDHFEVKRDGDFIRIKKGTGFFNGYFAVSDGDIKIPFQDNSIIILRLDIEKRLSEVLFKNADYIPEEYDMSLAEIKNGEVKDLRVFVGSVFESQDLSRYIVEIKDWISKMKNEDLNKLNSGELDLKIKSADDSIKELINRLTLMDKMDIFPIVNDTVTGGINSALSAEQGRILYEIASKSKKVLCEALNYAGVEIEETATFEEISEKISKIVRGYSKGSILVGLNETPENTLLRTITATPCSDKELKTVKKSSDFSWDYKYTKDNKEISNRYFFNKKDDTIKYHGFVKFDNNRGEFRYSGIDNIGCAQYYMDDKGRIEYINTMTGEIFYSKPNYTSCAFREVGYFSDSQNTYELFKTEILRYPMYYVKYNRLFIYLSFDESVIFQPRKYDLKGVFVDVDTKKIYGINYDATKCEIYELFFSTKVNGNAPSYYNTLVIYKKVKLAEFSARIVSIMDSWGNDGSFYYRDNDSVRMWSIHNRYMKITINDKNKLQQMQIVFGNSQYCKMREGDCANQDNKWYEAGNALEAESAYFEINNPEGTNPKITGQIGAFYNDTYYTTAAEYDKNTGQKTKNYFYVCDLLNKQSYCTEGPHPLNEDSLFNEKMPYRIFMQNNIEYLFINDEIFTKTLQQMKTISFHRELPEFYSPYSYKLNHVNEVERSDGLTIRTQNVIKEIYDLNYGYTMITDVIGHAFIFSDTGKIIYEFNNNEFYQYSAQIIEYLNGATLISARDVGDKWHYWIFDYETQTLKQLAEFPSKPKGEIDKKQVAFDEYTHVVCKGKTISKEIYDKEKNEVKYEVLSQFARNPDTINWSNIYKGSCYDNEYFTNIDETKVQVKNVYPQLKL